LGRCTPHWGLSPFENWARISIVLVVRLRAVTSMAPLATDVTPLKKRIFQQLFGVARLYGCDLAMLDRVVPHG